MRNLFGRTSTRWLLLCAIQLAGYGSRPLQEGAKVVALVFTSSECPISNKMAPEIERLSRKFKTNGVAVYLVYPNASDTEESIQQHRKNFRLTAPHFRDTEHEWVKKTGVRITPEAVVFDARRKVVSGPSSGTM